MYRLTLTNQTRKHPMILNGSKAGLADLRTRLERQGMFTVESPITANEVLPLVLIPENDDCDIYPHDRTSAWLVWNRFDLPSVRSRAAEHGALCVLPTELNAAALFQALENAVVLLASRNPNSSHSLSLKRGLDRNEQIHLEEDRVAFIRRGIVRCTSIHPDGDETLIGFYGPGDVLTAHIAHACDSHACHVEMRAHTTLTVTIEPWSLAITHNDFYTRLQHRICQMELWSSMQARPNAEARLLGILQVIASRFAKPGPKGDLLNIKLTHEQLAGAIGATRTTVTRLLGSLRKKGLLQVVKTPIGECFLLEKMDPENSHDSCRPTG